MKLERSNVHVPEFAYTFDGRIESLDYGRISYMIVRLSAELSSSEPFNSGKKCRFVGRIGGQNVALAWLPHPDGLYCIVSRSLARAAKVQLGSTVRIELNLVSESEVIVAAEIREALRQEPAFRTPWKALTPGKQRGLSHMVEKIKNDEARAHKAVEILTAVAEGKVPGPPRKRRDTL